MFNYVADRLSMNGGDIEPYNVAVRDDNGQFAHSGGHDATPYQGPSRATSFRVPLSAARTLNATGQSRVTLSLR